MLSDVDLLQMPLPDLMALARGVRDEAYGRRVTYSPKVFIPLTMLCRDRCGYCTFAKAPARLTSPYLTPDEVLSIARAGKEAGCHEALFTLGERPELRYPLAKTWLADNGFASTVDYLAHVCQLVLEETGLLPHANAGALYADELAVVAPFCGQPGHDARVAGRGARRAPQCTRQGAGPPAGHARGGRRAPHPLHDRDSGGHRRRPSRRSCAALQAIAASHARFGHVQEVIVQNFLPKPGTAMARAEPCPTDDLLWAIAVARLVLPAEVHIQAPPNLSDELAPLLAAGIDDWGGVSPITADHVNPERAWPALDTLRAATEDAGHVLAARLTVYPAFAHDAATWLDPNLVFPVLDVSDAEGLARDAAWCSGGEVAPPVLVGSGSGSGAGGDVGSGSGRARRWAGPVAEVLDGVALGQEVGEDEIVTLFSARGPEVRMVAEVADDMRRAVVGDADHVRAQPQHQLHQRLHLQVPLLCLLQGPALAEPARGAVPVGARRDHPPRG